MIFDKSKFEETKVDDVVTLNYKDEDAFKNGTDIKFSVLKEVESYRNKYIEDATVLASEESKRLMAKDKSINKVVVQYPFSTSKRGFVDVSVDRSKTYHIDKEKDPVIKSKVTVAVKDQLAKVSKSKIKDLETELTAALLK